MFATPEPRKSNSGSIRRSEFIKTVERVAPRVEIDQTRVLSDDELEELRRSFEQRQADRACAAATGRQGLLERIQKSASKAAELTPARGTEVPSAVELAEPEDLAEAS